MKGSATSMNTVSANSLATRVSRAPTYDPASAKATLAPAVFQGM